MKRIIILFTIFLLQLNSNAQHESWSWQSYTSMYDINSLWTDDSIIWCGTEGGLMAFDPVTYQFEYWMNTTGLAYNDVTAVIGDFQNRIWIGFSNGMIQRFDPVNNQWLLIDEYFNHPVHCLTLTGDTLLVGLDIGVSLFLISSNEVKETYRHLGQAFQVEIPVNEILIQGEDIWAATEEGIAHASLDNVNLLDPNSWENVTESDGLPSNSVNAFIEFENQIYAGTDAGVAIFNNGVWTDFDTTSLSLRVLDLIIFKETLFAFAHSRVYHWDSGIWSLYTPKFPYANTFIEFGNILWIGSGNGLVSYPEKMGDWIAYTPNTPKDNRFADLAIDVSGNLWCASASDVPDFPGRGFSRFDGSNWVNYDMSDISGRHANCVVSTTVDLRDNKWFGTWGGGLISLTPDDAIQIYNSSNSTLAGIPENNNYTVITDMVVDAVGTLWLLNYQAASNLPVVAVSTDSIWTRFGFSDGFTSTNLKTITIDTQNRKWIGSEDRGVFVLDDNGTPSDKSDDYFAGTLTTADGLETNIITALAGDKVGGIWIGTPIGLYHYSNGSVIRRYGLPSDNITALEVDALNNLWVGTGVGLSFFSDQYYFGLHYNADNSNLVSDDITSLVMDNATGRLYVGTSRGLSSITTQYSEPLPDLDELIVFPNPFHPEQDQFLTIDNLTWDVSVEIFTSAGYHVRSYSDDMIDGKQIYWDGKNDNGESVASGIYLVVASLLEGEKKIAKVALVR